MQCTRLSGRCVRQTLNVAQLARRLTVVEQRRRYTTEACAGGSSLLSLLCVFPSLLPVRAPLHRAPPASSDLRGARSLLGLCVCVLCSGAEGQTRTDKHRKEARRWIDIARMRYVVCARSSDAAGRVGSGDGQRSKRGVDDVASEPRGEQRKHMQMLIACVIGIDCCRSLPPIPLPFARCDCEEAPRSQSAVLCR
jgi:hypothetical protein